MDTDSRNTTAVRHAAAERPLRALVAAAAPEMWDAPSPCEGWTARDVVAHLVDTQRDFFGARGIDLGDRPDLGDPAAAWGAHSDRVARLLADDTVPAVAYEGYFGPTTVGAAFEQFYVWDLLVHRWDLARSMGRDTVFTDAELDRIEAGADSFGAALYTDGVCRPAVAAAGDSRQDRVLARLGRRAAR